MQKTGKSKIVKADATNINKLCRLISCEHADITPDDVGRIVTLCGDDGYGIEYTKKFKKEKGFAEETHVIYGEAKNVRLL